MKKKPNRILLYLICTLLLLALGKNFIIKIVAEQGCALATGMPLNIESFKLGIVNSLVDIKGFELQNPEQFKQDRLMVDVPEIFVDYRLMPLLWGKIHLDEVRFHLKNFVVVKNADGTTNLDALKELQKATEDTGEKKKTVKKKEKKKMDFQLDNFFLKIEKVTFISYDEEGKPTVKEFNINLNEDHQDIKSFEAVVGLVIFKALAKTTIASIANFDIQGLGSVVSGSIGGPTKAAKKVIGTTGEKVKSTAGTLKKLNPFEKGEE